MPSDYITPDETHPSHKGGMVSPIPAPYQGTAPQPRAASGEMLSSVGISTARDLELTGLPTGAVVMQANPTEIAQTNISPSQLGDPQPAPSLQTSPPPARPTEAAELVELRSRVGSLVQALSAKDAEIDRRLAELKFSQEAAQVAQNRLQPQAFPLPPGIEPGQTPTWEQLSSFFSYAVPAVQADARAQAIRATWDVTFEEEQRALQAYPVLATIGTEPARTQKTLEAVRLLRQATQAPASPAPASALAFAPLPETRPGRPTVPHTEYISSPVSPDAPAVGAMELAIAEYNQVEASLRSARTDAERKERLLALRRASEKVDSLRGITDEMRRYSSFHERL